ncbi:hypothetical protein JS565_16540 [Salmonella enterica subsp. enterica serovar Senftenberg]|nr:hypothetical protein [Salmonella enterica subsp. enterica serovar Senftenberg]
MQRFYAGVAHREIFYLLVPDGGEPRCVPYWISPSVLAPRILIAPPAGEQQLRQRILQSVITGLTALIFCSWLIAS